MSRLGGEDGHVMGCQEPSVPPTQAPPVNEPDHERTELLERAVQGAAEKLHGSPDTLVEKDLEIALLDSLAPHISTERQRHLKLESWHGSLGAADIAIEDASGPDLIEAKWGSAALWNCAWDVAKLATAIAEGAARGGFLVAGASLADWEAGVEGSELFDTEPWSVEDLLHRYGRRFAFWRTDVENCPLKLADRWWVIAHRSAPLQVAGEEYVIRLAEVLVEDAALLPIAYAPQLATWTRGYPADEVVEVPPDQGPIEADSQERVKSLDEASELSGPLTRLGAGEGFSVHVGSGHFVATDEGTMRDFADEETEASLAEKPVTLRRFSSPGARRAWLASRRQIRLHEPEIFSVVSGSGLGSWSELVWRDRSLAYDYRDMSGLASGSRRLRPSPAAWGRLWAELDRIGVWDWLPECHPSMGVTDGYEWELAISVGGRMVTAKGYEAFPDKGSISEEMSPEWAAFLRALRDLLGGLPLA